MLDQGITRIGPVEICDGAWLGQNVVIGPNVRVGIGSVVGANSVVLSDVPDFSVAVGAPARVVRSFGADVTVRTLLFLSYYFPPIGGAGAQRPLKMVRYLERNGYRSRVLTGPGPGADRWAPSDATLAVEVPEQAEIHRLAGPEPLASAGWRGRGERWLSMRSAWAAWWIEGGLDAAREPDSELGPHLRMDAAVRLSPHGVSPLAGDGDSLGRGPRRSRGRSTR